MSALRALMIRDIRLAWRGGGAASLSLGFFVISASLYPFGLGPDPFILQAVAPGVIWVTAIFAALLSLDRMFQADFEDGTLTQLLLSRLTPTAIVMAKVAAHWLAVMLPLVLVSPVLGLMLGLPGDALVAQALSLAVGTPALSLLGAVAGGLTIAVRRGGALITLLLLPLFVPTLIFGVALVDSYMSGAGTATPFALLGASSLFAVAIGPPAAAAALRLAVE